MPNLTSLTGPVSGTTTPVLRTSKLHPDATQLRPVPTAMGWPAELLGSGCVATYPYCDERGRLLTVLGRCQWPEVQESGRTEMSIVPFTAWQQPDGCVVWVRKYLLGPRPLYGLLDLLARGDVPVILSENENGADAVRAFLPTAVSVTWMGGVKGIAETDFAPIKGRDVWIFPRHDAPGRRAAAELIKALRKAGVARVWILDIAALSHLILGAAPTGCDIADVIAAGLTADGFSAQIKAHPTLLTEVDLTNAVVYHADEAPTRSDTQATPQADVVDQPQDGVLDHLCKVFGHLPDLPEGFELNERGLFKIAQVRNRELAIFAASPLAVLGRTRRGADGNGWGSLVAFINPTGQWGTAVIPMRKLAGEGREVREALSDLGVTCAQDRAGRLALSESIAYSCRQVTDIIDITEHPGWVGDDAFALPNRILLPLGSNQKIMLDIGGRDHRYRTSGTFEGWQAMAEALENNSRGALAICMSFAGPLIRPLGEEGGGVHLWGRTSTSKTSIVIAAGATWGGDPRDGFIESWRATDNGVEALAALYNDTLFILDELALVDPDRLADILYMLSGGRGKARATQTGTGQPVSTWISMVLSTGEITTGAHIKSGIRGVKARVPGGVAARVVDLPIALAPGLKRSFEDLGAFDNEQSLADQIKADAKQHYGHAGPAFLEAFLACRDDHIAAAKIEIEGFTRDVRQAGEASEVGRVARRFGLIAAAGEMAIRFGILPWREGAAHKAALTCYAAWTETQGSSALSVDEHDALSALKQFFELHGASRFEPLVPQVADSDIPAERLDDRIVRDRCGYRRYDAEQGTTYYVTPEAWRSEICTPARDPDFVARLALTCGALIPGEGTRLLKNVRLPDQPHPRRVYVIRPDLLP